jgi:hypothetical protein
VTSGPQDDDSVSNPCRLFRRITHQHLAPAGDQPGGVRISSAAFQSSSDGSGVSVSIEDRMIELGIGPGDLLEDHPGAFLAFITAGTARELGKGIVREPTDDDPAHGNLTGPDTSGIRKRLARAAQWEQGPTD